MEGIAKRHRRIRAGLTVLLAGAATLALSASPALASGTYSGRDYVYGADGFGDDWGDEGVLSTSMNTYSNATCLWQEILWADGYLSVSDIDGAFGAKTKAATKAWQTKKKLPDVDGVAGKDTFGRADDNLRKWDEDSDGTLTLYYDGVYYQPTFVRQANGTYGFYMYDGTEDYRLAGYNYRSCG
ncbi:peptidoglycan-binding domain-containing protein [Streptomyces cellulosae]|jgi:peptidoglycan hydrolase-like protein with peptidoglycan-binding domain|uniref:Peptidoglycan-binding protein n=1 Tax=Streptomyces cellulosae TaxID=1968 RepID=A0ABW7XSQ7_STRCE